MSRNEQQLNELHSAIDQFNQFEKKTLISRTEWGTLSFESAKPDFDRIYDIMQYLTVLPLEILTAKAITNISNEIKSTNTILTKINDFSIETGNPSEKRNGLVGELQNAADNLYTQATPWIPFLAYKKGDVAHNIEALTTSVNKAKELIDSAKQSISDKESEVQEIVIKAREASAAAGAAVFTQDFLKESSALRDSAMKWLRITGYFAFGTIAIALTMWFFTEAGLDKGQLWQKLGTKIAILGILISSTFWCGKIYKALMHQATINKHRALSIQTLQAFSAAVENVAAKDAVVVEATRAVFGNVPTGYIDSPQTNDSDVKIFEIAKSIIPKPG